MQVWMLEEMLNKMDGEKQRIEDENDEIIS